VLDRLVDNHKPVIDELRAELEEIGELVLTKSDESRISKLLHVRSDINRLRQIVRPQRDVVSRLAHGENRHVRASMLPYFRDLRDDLLRIDETASTYADQLLISFDLYLSKSDFQANNGIKVPTALPIPSSISWSRPTNHRWKRCARKSKKLKMACCTKCPLTNFSPRS
jgi:magnesium transporter